MPFSSSKHEDLCKRYQKHFKQLLPLWPHVMLSMMLFDRVIGFSTTGAAKKLSFLVLRRSESIDELWISEQEHC